MLLSSRAGRESRLAPQSGWLTGKKNRQCLIKCNTLPPGQEHWGPGYPIGPRAGGPLSAVTVLGRAQQSTDTGCNEVMSLGPGPPGRDRAIGQAGHRTGPPDRATWPAAGHYTVCCHAPGADSPKHWRVWAHWAVPLAVRKTRDFTLGGRLAKGPGIRVRANDHRVRRRLAVAAPSLGPGPLHFKLPEPAADWGWPGALELDYPGELMINRWRLAGPLARQWGPGPLQGQAQSGPFPRLQGWRHRTGRPWPGRAIICGHDPAGPDRPRLTGALTLAAGQSRVTVTVSLSLGPVGRYQWTWPWATARVQASCLPQAARLALVTLHQERLLTRKVASQTDDVYNKISILIHMHTLCYI